MTVTLRQECDKAKRVDVGKRRHTTPDACMTRFIAA
jgi:hypothetical protein